jgi:hypothetical protein
MSLSTCALICAVLVAAALGEHDPARQRFSESFLVNDLMELPFDENDRLIDNWLLYLDNKECKALTERVWVKDRPAYRNIASMSQSVSDKFFEDESKNYNRCNAVTIPRGTSRQLIRWTSSP